MARLRTLFAEFKAFAFKGNMIDLAIAVVIGAAFSGVIDSLVKDIILPTISYATTAVKEAKDAAVQAVDAATEVISPTTKPATQPTTPATQPVAATQPAAAAEGGEASAGVPTTRDTEANLVAEKMIGESAEPRSKEWKEMVSAFATALAADRKAADAKAAIAKAEAERKAAEEKPVNFTWKIGRLNMGNFIGALLNFAIIACAVFLIMVKMLGGVMKRVGSTPAPEQPTTKECAECLSVIPIKARRCSHCASPQPPDATPTV